MRKNLKEVPVFGPTQQADEAPIDHVSVQEADARVSAGAAISLKGRAIRMLPLSRQRDLSARPDHRVMYRYAVARASLRDKAVEAAIESWTGTVKSGEDLRTAAAR